MLCDALLHEVNSFDNVWLALITIFQCISLEGWVDVMYMLQDATNQWVWVYFVPLVVVGGFFVVNLFLAVIFDSFFDATSGQEAA